MHPVLNFQNLDEVTKMYHNLTEGKISRSLLLFALPMMAGNLLQQFYNIADTLIVGRVLFFLPVTGTRKLYDSSGISGSFRNPEHRTGSFICCGTPMGHPRCSVCNCHRTACFRNRHHIVRTSQMPGSAAIQKRREI